MNPLILDQMKRRWFFWALFCFVHLLFGSFNYGFFGSDFIFPAAFILGPNIWLMDLQRGYSRVALTLPYTARQIGRTWWWIAVGLAAILMIAFSFLGMSLHVLFSGNEFPFARWFEYVTANILLYGSLFWFFSGAFSSSNLSLSSIYRQKKIPQFFAFIFSLAFIGGCVYLLFNMQKSSVEMAAFYICTLTMTILGWLRAESMIADYSEYRNASQQPKNSQGQFKVQNGFGGIPLIFWTAFSGIWSFGIMFLIVMNLYDLFIKHQFDWHHLTRSISNGGSFFPVFFVLMLSRFSVNHDLRFLRTLPASTAGLAATLLSVQILPLLTLCLAFTALAWNETGSAECISLFKIELLAVAPLIIFIAVSIWNTQGNFIKAVVLAILIVAAMSPMFYQLACLDGRDGLPFWLITIFDMVIAGLAFWSTCKIIAKSSSAYRPRQNQLGNRWSWLGSER